MPEPRPKHPVVAGSAATMFEMLFAYPLEYVKVNTCTVPGVCA
jgi:hypothetical protein